MLEATYNAGSVRRLLNKAPVAGGYDQSLSHGGLEPVARCDLCGGLSARAGVRLVEWCSSGVEMMWFDRGRGVYVRI